MALCKNPYMKGVIACGCGSCKPCLVNRRRLWSSRIMLESLNYENNAFVTLTYSPEKMPPSGSLVPSDVQLWLKRLRERIFPETVRYFLAGEYGDKEGRPHYHVALFGFASCERGRTEHRLKSCCARCDLVARSWGLGGVDVGELNQQTAQYVAGYVVKKMTKKDDPRLLGRYPEFIRMSLKPGIGALSLQPLADACKSSAYALKLAIDGDVPPSLLQGKKSMPLGRYLRRKLREKIGRAPETPSSVLGRYCTELQTVLGEARKAEELAGTPSCFLDKKALTTKKNIQRIRNLEAKEKIFTAKRNL